MPDDKMGIFGLILIAMLVITPYLYFTSTKFRYNLKFFIYYGICMFTGVWVVPYAFITSPSKPRSVANIKKVQAFWNFSFKLFGVDVEVRNQEYLQSDECSVILSNHQSSLDMIPMFQTFPTERCRPSALAKKELLYAGMFGWGAYLCGLVFVDRLNKERARDTMEKTVKQIQDEKINIWIFPEGTRHMAPDLEMLEFKKGGFHLAVGAQCPIVPVVFSSYRHFISKKEKTFNPGKVIATCLPPISTKGMTSDDVNDLVKKTRDLMMEVHRKTTQEIEEWVEKQGKPSLLKKSS